jgi:hypothetical protein
MAQKAFESITLGRMRSHGCRDLLILRTNDMFKEFCIPKGSIPFFFR